MHPLTGPGGHASRRQVWIISLLLIAGVLALYWPALHFGFVNYDDSDYVTENIPVLNGLSLKGVSWAFTTVTAANWHPLTWLSHMLDVQLYGLNAGRHHLTSILLHAANSVLLFLALSRLTKSPWPSAIVAGFFAFHPCHVESVAWISERKDVLSTFFFMSALLAYSAYAAKPKSSYYLLTLALFAFGLMAKPMIVTLPFVLLLLDFWPLGRISVRDDPGRRPLVASIRRLILEKTPFFVLTLASSAWTFIAQHGAGAASTLHDLPILNRIANALIAYLRYTVHLLWPTSLCIYYPHPWSWPLWQIAGAAVVLATVTAVAILQRSRRPFMAVGWLWFLGTLVPVIGVVQVGSQSIADRYTYIPSIGFFILLVWTVGSFMNCSSLVRGASGTVAVVALGICCVMARIQVGYWENSNALFSHAITVTPENYMAHFCLGNALIAEGKIPEGRDHLRRSAEINPSFANAHGALGVLASQAGDFKEAIRQYTAALTYQPDSAGALNNLAWLFATCPDPAERNGAEAVNLALRACDLTQYRKALLVGTLAAAYAEAGRFQEAVETAERARQIALEWNQSDVANRNAELMQLYKAGSAFHETPSK